MDRDEITAELAARLIAEQFPQWAGLAVRPVDLNGWDNTTFRLGDHLSIRLPSGAGYAPAVAKEQRWLPVLAPQLPKPIPEPVALGRPGCGYPWPWSVNRWLPGTPAGLAPIADLPAFADDLADFLGTLYGLDATGGPPPEPGYGHRGGPLSTYDDEEIPEATGMITDRSDVRAVADVWQAALATEWDRAPVWLHGDVVGANLLVADGRLSAVIDFGCSAVGDPSCDLAVTWTFFEGASARRFRDALALDEATWARGRGWALWKALVTIRRARVNGGDEYADARRFGWRHDPYQVVENVLADHRRS